MSVINNPHTSSTSAGFICTALVCAGRTCPGTHFNYYLNMRVNHIPMIMNGHIYYISPEGLDAYYQIELNRNRYMPINTKKRARLEDSSDNMDTRAPKRGKYI